MSALKSGSLAANHASEMARIGGTIAKLRRSNKMKQEVAALQAGLSRDTAYRIEKGESNIAIGQIYRYLDAISPGLSLSDVLTENISELSDAPHPPKRRRVSLGAPVKVPSSQGK